MNRVLYVDSCQLLGVFIFAWKLILIKYSLKDLCV